MKLHKLIEADAHDIDHQFRSDGLLEKRLKVIDANIDMFSNKIYDKNAHVQGQLKALRDGREKLIAFYDGKIGYGQVPYHIWDLTSTLPDWATYGT